MIRAMPERKRFFSIDVFSYGPQQFSKNGENVLSFLHGLPGETWPEPDEDDPLSLVDEVR